MKRNPILFTILTVVCLYAAPVFAQIPQSFSYQAIVSDNKGTPIVGKIGVKVSILHKQENGTTVYMERHDKTTDSRGFVSLMIGEGTSIYLGKIDTINWANGPYFLKVEIAPTGGYVFPISSVSKILSVPYALFAQRADSVSSLYVESDPVFNSSVAKKITALDTLRWNAFSQKVRYQIGQLAHGGIIFYVTPDGNHGLVASLNDFNENDVWSNSKNIVIGNYNDWYVPSADEMNLVLKSQYLINKTLEGSINTSGLIKETYWTSTEKNATDAYLFEMGSLKSFSKSTQAAKRAIRAF